MTNQLSAFIKFAFKTFPELFGQFASYSGLLLSLLCKMETKFNVASKFRLHFNYITVVLLCSD